MMQIAELQTGDQYDHDKHGSVTVIQGQLQFNDDMEVIKDLGKITFSGPGISAETIKFEVDETGAVLTEPLADFIRATVAPEDD